MKFKLNSKKKEPRLEVELEDKVNFPRTESTYSLNEVLFIMNKFISNTPIGEVAKLVKRSPAALRFKFLEYRPINSDGSLDFFRSVKTEKESKLDKKVSMYKLNQSQVENTVELLAGSIDTYNGAITEDEAS